MDPITLAIVLALAAGVTTGLADQAATDLYILLKENLQARFGKGSALSQAADRLEENPASRGDQKKLAEEVVASRAGEDEDIVQAAEAMAAALPETQVEYYSCFISYSSEDQEFVEKLHADLLAEGISCWFAPEDLRIGDKIRPTIDNQIRLRDKLLLVLSEHSIRSAWVENEVEAAFEEERLNNKLVLFPIRLDETFKDTPEAWAATIRRQRHIGDFSLWEDRAKYQQALARLLRDLKQSERDG